MRKLLIISGALALVGGASAAQADSLGRPCTDKPEGQYLSLDALKAKVVEQGYEIRSGSIKEACGEFYVLDKAGKRAELFLDPTTGAIVAGGGQAAGEAADSGKAAATDSKESGGEKADQAGDKDADEEKVGEADGKSGDKDRDDN